MGIISGALGGLGEAAIGVGARWQKQIGDETLQEKAAAIQAQRDKTLLEMKEQFDIRGENRKRDQAAAVGTEAEAARTGMVDDLSGTVRPRTALRGFNQAML